MQLSFFIHKLCIKFHNVKQILFLTINFKTCNSQIIYVNEKKDSTHHMCHLEEDPFNK